ncbi:MAG: oligosaccharide flippase family protein [Bacteroidales bacterium]
MGIIQKQTLKGTVYSYIGVVIGFLNMGILYPRIFTAEEIGLTQVMLSIATILSQLGNLGFGDMSNRIFPWFREKLSGNRGFLGLGLIITLTGTIIVTALLVLNLDNVVYSSAERTSLLDDYSGFLPLLLVLTIWFTFFDNYVRILYNAVLGTFLRDLLYRVLNLILIGLYYFRLIDFDGFILLFVLSQGLPQIIILIIWMSRNNELVIGNFRLYIDRKMAKQLASLSIYGLITSISGITVANIDKYMINFHLGLDQAGIYAISFYFATIILIPGKSLGKIAAPVIADAWKREDLKTVSDIYARSCINQTAIGVLMVIGIIANLHNIYRILPESYAGGEWIIILISLANFIFIATGASIYVLGTSSYYRLQTWLMLLMIILVLATNYLLIPVMGIVGAALASFISVVIISALRVYIIWLKIGLWPFRARNLALIGIGLAIYLLSLLIPRLVLIADIAVRSSFITLLFLGAVYFLNLSREIKDMIDNVINMIRKK